MIFRRTCPQIRAKGSLWEASAQIYPLLGGKPRETDLSWTFPSGATIQFAHMEHATNRFDWQGSEIPLIGWDELTHFEEEMFFYLLSRSRSTCGVNPYIRATTNPDALSWVKEFLSPWLDPTHPEPAKGGELRWFVRDGGQILWVEKGTPDSLSVTFIFASIYDNPILMQKDPKYLANLKALPPVERARLLEGDWDIVQAGEMFDRDWFEIIDWSDVPSDMEWVRFYDMASSKPKPGYTDPDQTCGALCGIDRQKTFYVADVESMRETPGKVREAVIRTARRDLSLGRVPVAMEQEPGSLSAFALDQFARDLFDITAFYGRKPQGSKRERAKPVSAYAQRGLVKLVRGPWVHRYLNILSAFPTPGVHDDEVDATSGGFEFLGGPHELELSPEAHKAFWGAAR